MSEHYSLFLESFAKPSAATLYLGSHHATTRWWALGIPLFVSVRVLKKRRGLPVAVAPWALDSWLFLTIAFGSLAFFWGQFWGKFEMVAIGVALTLVRRIVTPVAA